MVLKTVDAALMIPLKKSSAGHLLIDLCDNWLQGGSRIFFHSDISVEEKGSSLPIQRTRFVRLREREVELFFMEIKA